jgi:hypothetical protein
MTKHNWLTILLILCLTSCTGVQPTTPIIERPIEPQFSPSPSVKQTLTITQSIPSTHTPTVQVTSRFKFYCIEGNSGYWADKTNSFLYKHNEKDGTVTLGKVLAPDFKPVTLRSQLFLNSFDNLFWSPDNKAVLFTCSGNCLEKNSGRKEIYIMDADGDKLHSIYKDNEYDVYDENKESFRFGGWANDHELILEQRFPSGNTEISTLIIETEMVSPWGATVYGNGRSYASYNGYIPVTTDTYQADPRIMVISSKFPSSKLEERAGLGGNVLRFPEYRSIPNLQTISGFEDWLPVSNQILVYWGLLDAPITAQVKAPQVGEMKLRETNLFLWNIDTNTVRLVAPNGIGGRFSPDGKILAYFTQGPAQLDQSDRPIKTIVDLTKRNTDYMQLLDVESSKVVLSVPVLVSGDRDDYDLQVHGFLQAGFSPNGRYLAFRSPWKLEVNEKGQPQSGPTAFPNDETVNILDLLEGTIIWSSPAGSCSVLSWSPTSNQLLFCDRNNSFQILDLTTFRSVAMDSFLSSPEWSYNGQYISFISCEPVGEYSCGHRSIYIFDVTPEQ